MTSRLEVTLPPLHPGQAAVAASRARFKVLAAGRRFGKTSLAVTLCLRTALEGGRTWWVGPTFPLAQIGWRILKRFSRQIPGVEIREADRLVILPGRGEVQVKSADNPDALRGAGLDGVVIDEAAYVKEDAWTESLRPALTDRQGWALFISTPNGLNWFYGLYQRAQQLPGWQAWQCPTWENPRIATDELDLARQQEGELVFRQEFGAEFLDFGTLKPFRPEWIRYAGRDGEPEPPPGLIVEAGMDPAISQKDTAARSALVIAGQARDPLHRGRLFVLEAIAGHWSVWEQVDAVCKAVARRSIRRVRVEKTAYQAALKDLLDREAKTRGLHVHVELVPPDADKLRRANAWSPLVEDGTVLFGPGQQDLIDSMLAIPHDSTRWDLVDAAGYCLRGFPALESTRTRLPGQTVSTPDRAASYAQRGRGLPLNAVVTWEQFRGFGARTPDLRRRARGYALRRPS